MTGRNDFSEIKFVGEWDVVVAQTLVVLSADVFVHLSLYALISPHSRPGLLNPDPV